MTYIPPNPNGQATMVNSQPVVIASDQAAVPISAASLPLPAGAATAAAQTTGNASLASVDTKTPALGQALAAASTPVVLTAVQVTTLTPQTNALTDTQLRATAVPVSLASTTVTGTVTVSGTVTSNIGTTNGIALDATLTGGTAKSILRTAAKGTTVAADTTSTPVDANTQALDVAVKGTVPVSGTFFQATQPVSIAGTVTTTGTLTDTQLRATAVPVSLASTTVTGTVAVTDNAGSLTVDAPVGTPAFVRLSDGAAAITTLPVSLATLPALTASTANIGDVDVLTVNGVAPAFGTGVRAATVQRVTIATDDLVPVSAASLPLPTGAATSALQSTLDTSINTLLKPASTLAAVTTVSAVTAITNALPAGTNLMGKVGIDQTTPGTTNAVVVTANGVVSTANSSAAALGISGVFTGTSEDVTEYADIRVYVFSDQASATDGLKIQQSSNGTNWDIIDSYSIPASTGKNFSIGVSAKFFRIVYTNGGVAQTAFRLQAKLQKTYTKSSSVRPQDARTNDNDMEEQLGYNMVYNGTSWDRVRGTTANGIAVDVTRNAALVAGTALIGKVGIDQTTPGTTNRVDIGTVNSVAPAFGTGVRGANVQRVTIATDDVVPALQSGTWTVQPGNTANTTPWLVNQTPRATGGATPSVTISAASTNATSLKASAGTVFGIQVFNTNAAARYLKLYNKASAPTVGTDTPVKVITIPGNTAGAGAVVSLPDHGVAFSTGIAWALTTGAAHTDTGAVALSEIIVNIDYI